MDPEFRETCEAQEKARRGILAKPSAAADPKRFFDSKTERFPTRQRDDGCSSPIPGQYEVSLIIAHMFIYGNNHSWRPSPGQHEVRDVTEVPPGMRFASTTRIRNHIGQVRISDPRPRFIDSEVPLQCTVNPNPITVHCEPQLHYRAL